MSVVTEFLENEFNAYVREVLLRELDAERSAYLTFNIFNVRIDPELALVTIEDELDPDREESLGVAEFRAMVERSVP
jgi:hypothetical protein